MTVHCLHKKIAFSRVSVNRFCKYIIVSLLTIIPNTTTYAFLRENFLSVLSFVSVLDSSTAFMARIVPLQVVSIILLSGHINADYCVSKKTNTSKCIIFETVIQEEIHLQSPPTFTIEGPVQLTMSQTYR